jgi:multiple sugar transport system substrate-binding protein
MKGSIRRTVGLILLLGLTACASEIEPTPGVIPPPTVTSPPSPTQTSTPAPELIPGPTETPIPTEGPAIDLQGVTLRFWHTSTQDREYALLSLINEFNASNEYGIIVTAFGHGSELYTDVSEAIPTGDLPNVTVAYNNQLKSWDNYGGVIVDLDDYLFDPEWGFSDAELSDFYPAFWNQDVVAGVRLGLPFYRSAMVLFYNQSWAQELGFDAPPSTPAEFEEQACAAAEANNNGTGGWIVSSDIGTISSWIFAFSGELVKPDGSGYLLDTPETESAFSFLRGLLDAGCAWFPGVQYPNEEFVTRLGLFATSSVAGIPFQQRAFEDEGSRDRWTVIPFPGVDGEPVIDVYGPSYAIFESTPQQQLASWIFIKWISEPQNQARWVEASNYFPSRASTLDYLVEHLAANPQYTAAEALIPYSRYEPSYGSWGVARWAVSDYGEQLFSPEFRGDQIPAMLAELDVTLAEIHLNYR